MPLVVNDVAIHLRYDLDDQTMTDLQRLLEPQRGPIKEIHSTS